MATRALLRAVIRVLASPLVMLSYVIECLGLFNIKNDLQRCLKVVDEAPLLPYRFVATLAAAEDHRSSIHPGVDPIAIVRALLVWVKIGKVQGASTIEQQLVRVVVCRYERSLKRKFLEQMIALALSRQRSKDRIAMAYLSVAYYGSGRFGMSALARICGSDLYAAGQARISLIVARLKYPEPLLPSKTWRKRIVSRAQYIGSRMPETKQIMNSVPYQRHWTNTKLNPTG